MVKVTICGGGHLGHSCAGFLAAQADVEVRVLTRRPQLWADTIVVTDLDGKCYAGTLRCVTADPAVALADADIALFCLPGYAIEEELQKIKPHLAPSTVVGTIVSSTGFFFRAFEQLPATQPLFGFQRVPFISRIREYGHSVDLLGYKPSLAVAIEQCEGKEALRACIETLFHCPVSLLASHYEVSLTNSNPLLHTSRLYTMWRDYREGAVYARRTLFYSEWTDEASALLMAMDDEFQQLLVSLGVRQGAIPTILDYYESRDAASLTQKLRSIKAFQNLPTPMREVMDGFVPDFTSRYFIEDFPYGLRFIHDLAHEKGISCPHIDEVYQWGHKLITPIENK